MVSNEHQQRIRRELAKAGVTIYGQSKMSSRHLPKIIHEDEHIKGVVYGRCAHGFAMLIATDKRVIYLERRPIYASTDELTYDVVSGVRMEQNALFSAVDLHTRIGNYSLNYVNPKCAEIFVEYIEKRVEHISPLSDSKVEQLRPTTEAKKFSEEARQFLLEHEYTVLSSANRTGEIYSAVVNYVLGEEDQVYILTKADTAKAHNMIGNSHVAMTIYDANSLQTVQLQGDANIETNLDVKHKVFNDIVRPRNYGGESLLPPVTQLTSGAFIVFRITPTNIKFSDFKQPNTFLPSTNK